MYVPPEDAEEDEVLGDAFHAEFNSSGVERHAKPFWFVDPASCPTTQMLASGAIVVFLSCVLLLLPWCMYRCLYRHRLLSPRMDRLLLRVIAKSPWLPLPRLTSSWLGLMSAPMRT